MMDKVKVRCSLAVASLGALLVFCAIGHEAAAGGKASRGSIGGVSRAPITITSKSMHADRTARTIVFKGDVEAREDFLLCSDELYLNYTGANEVRKIDARGNVRIFRDTGLARAVRAVYDRQEHTLVLSGKAVIERCADIVRGDKITLYLDDDSALVEGANKGRVKAVIVPDKKCDGTFGAKGVKIDAKDSLCKKSR